MSITLYANGLTEENVPKNLMFSDEELIDLYRDFEIIKSYRISEIPNTWCIWGEHIPYDKIDDEYNQFASDIIDTDIFSPITFIHDTEINPDWNLTDPIIQYGYQDFKGTVYKYFDEIARIIIKNREQDEKESNSNTMIILEQVGVFEKKIIYQFDLNKQSEDFFTPDNFIEFSNRIYKFLSESYDDGDIFVIYADKNIIVQIDDNQVKTLINKIIATLQPLEEYEKCSDLKNILNRWKKYKKNNPIKDSSTGETPKEQDPI